jgi:peroxiredoxin
MKLRAALSVSCLIFSMRVLVADEESSAWDDFQRLIRAADPKAAQTTFKRDHPNPPSKQEGGEMVETITHAAVSVMDQAKEFENRFPQSTRLTEIRSSLVETLSRDFGSMGLPIPASRAADLEACIRSLLLNGPEDVPLHLVLCRVAASLPTARQFALYEELSQEPTPEPVRSMAQEALRKLERLGVPLVLSFTALDGRLVSLVDLQGKVVLIDFWSTTCLPCLRELPDLKKVYGKYRSQGVEFIGVSLDSNKQVLQRFIQKQQIPWPQYFDPAGPTNRLAQEFGVRSIPMVWLVDRHGMLRHLNGRENAESKIETLLKAP